MEYRYHEVDLGAVINYYAKDFSIIHGKKIVQHEAFIDTAKRTVIFKLLVEKDTLKRKR